MIGRRRVVWLAARPTVARRRELGYVEGQNLVLETRFGEGRYGRRPELAAELVRARMDVIVAVSPNSIRAAKDLLRADLVIQ